MKRLLLGILLYVMSASVYAGYTIVLIHGYLSTGGNGDQQELYMHWKSTIGWMQDIYFLMGLFQMRKYDKFLPNGTYIP